MQDSKEIAEYATSRHFCGRCSPQS